MAFGTDEIWMDHANLNVMPRTEGLEESNVTKSSGDDNLMGFRQRAIGFIRRQVGDDVSLVELLNIDTLPTGAGCPLFEELSPWYVLRFEGYVEMAVPLSGAATDVDDISASEHVAPPEGALTELPEPCHDVFNPGVG